MDGEAQRAFNPPAAARNQYPTVQEVEGGFQLRYQTLDGLPGVAAQLALDFPPGGIWETEPLRYCCYGG